MYRLFGRSDKAAKPSIKDAIAGIDSRVGALDVRLAKINGELAIYQQKLAGMRDGPGKQALKQRALKLLRQRKQIEMQKDQLEAQSWNMEQTSMVQENLRNTMVTADAMQTANKELRRQYGKVNIDKIEKIQDEMTDLMDTADELQETMARGYNIPEDVDEAELDAELEALGTEMEFEPANIGAVPSYLEEEPPQFIDDLPQKEAAS